MMLQTGGIDYHERISATWIERYQSASFHKRHLAFSHILSAKAKKGQRWLDAGCGAGTLSALIARHGSRVIGIDGSMGMIMQARAFCQDREAFEFHKIDNLETWRWNDDPFDGILCSSVIEYLTAPEQLISRFSDWLVPKGTLLLSVPNSWSFFRNLQKLCFSVTDGVTGKGLPRYLRYSINDFSPNAMRGILARHGFAIESLIPFGIPGRIPCPESRFVSPLLLAVATKLSDV